MEVSGCRSKILIPHSSDSCLSTVASSPSSSLFSTLVVPLLLSLSSFRQRSRSEPPPLSPELPSTVELSPRLNRVLSRSLLSPRASSGPAHVSFRANSFAKQADSPYYVRLNRVFEDPFDELNNPDGFFQLGLAENKILDVIDHSCAPNHQMTHLRGLKFLMHSEKLLAMASLLQELGLSVMVDTDPCNSLLALIMSKCLLSYQVCGFSFLHFDARFENRPSHFNIPKSNVTEPGHWICNLSLNRHLKAVHFEVSSIMSTYLVAVVMGLFDRVEDKISDGIVVCAYCPVGKSDKGKFAPSIAVKALDIFRK